jgi:hypothetical protein
MVFIGLSLPESIFKNGLNQPSTSVRDVIGFYSEFGPQARLATALPQAQIFGLSKLVWNPEPDDHVVLEKRFHLTPVPSISQLSLSPDVIANSHFTRSFR